METIKFNLLGAGACFKKPHVNSINLTYSHIHKVALLGLIGAALGLEGHDDKEKDEEFPRFYRDLKGLKVSILPETPFIRKTTKSITETTGFSNKGSTFVGREQVLINPRWTIYIQQGKICDDLFLTLKDILFNNYAKFIPYLGRNHHEAAIEDFEVVNLEPVNVRNVSKVDSFINSRAFDFVDDFSLEDNLFELAEYYPVRYRPFINYYIEEKMYLTNKAIEIKSGANIYIDEGHFLYFF